MDLFILLIGAAVSVVAEATIEPQTQAPATWAEWKAMTDASIVAIQVTLKEYAKEGRAAMESYDHRIKALEDWKLVYGSKMEGLDQAIRNFNEDRLRPVPAPVPSHPVLTTDPGKPKPSSNEWSWPETIGAIGGTGSAAAIAWMAYAMRQVASLNRRVEDSDREFATNLSKSLRG